VPRGPTNADEPPDPSGRAMSFGDIPSRVMRVEWELEAVERRLVERLDNGAERFSAHKRQLADLEQRMQPKAADKWRVAGFIVGVAVMVGGWVWQAAKYPDRSEYAAIQTRIDALDDQVDNRIQLLREAQVDSATKTMLIGRDLEQLTEAVKRLEAELAQQRRRRR